TSPPPSDPPGADTVPRIRPTPHDVRRRYRDQLAPGQRRAFDRLSRLIDAPRGDLAWHHAVGGLVGLLRAEESHGSGWARGLAQALVPSDGLLARRLFYLRRGWQRRGSRGRPPCRSRAR